MKRAMIAPDSFLALPDRGPRSRPLALARTARSDALPTPAPHACRPAKIARRPLRSGELPAASALAPAGAGAAAGCCCLAPSPNSLPCRPPRPPACQRRAAQRGSLPLNPSPIAAFPCPPAAAVNVRAVATGADKPSKDALQDVASDASAVLQAKGQELLTYAQVGCGWA